MKIYVSYQLSMTELSTASTQTTTPAVEIKQLVKDFVLPGLRKRLFRAVDDVSFRIQPGEVFGLIGPNGSGKSTTLKALLGLVRPTSGYARIFGVDGAEHASREAVGYLPENPYFYKHLTGEETIQFYGKLCGLSGKALRERTKELLALVRLENAADRRVAGFSKGMLQRVGLAQSLVQNPRMVVLDEPTAGVDPAGSRLIRDLIMEFKCRGITIILTSHLLEQVQEVCDNIGIMSRGKMVRQGSLNDLMRLQDQQELVIQGASAELLEKLKALVAADTAAKLVHAGESRTTLEELYLTVTTAAEEETQFRKP
jgi:ABC-2 type transport system ATP-binding protein